MNFEEALRTYLKSKGYELLGEDYGMWFFENENGEITGAGGDALLSNMKREGYWM